MMKKLILLILCLVFTASLSGCYVQSTIMSRSSAIEAANILVTCQTEDEVETVLQEHVYGMIRTEDLYIILASAPYHLAPYIASKLTPYVIDNQNIPLLYEYFIDSVKSAGLQKAGDAKEMSITPYLGHMRVAYNKQPLNVDVLYSYVQEILQNAPVISAPPQEEAQNVPSVEDVSQYAQEPDVQNMNEQEYLSNMPDSSADTLSLEQNPDTSATASDSPPTTSEMQTTEDKAEISPAQTEQKPQNHIKSHQQKTFMDSL